MFMFHNYSSMTHGKGGEMYDNIIHERKWSEHLLKRIYDGFLHDGEISALLANKDIWMDGEEVLKRLAERQKKFEKLAKAMTNEKPVQNKRKVQRPAKPVARKNAQSKK